MELFKDTHLVKLELLSNAMTIDSALHHIRSKQQEQQQQKKRLGLDSTTSNENNNSDDGQLTTAGGRQTIFWILFCNFIFHKKMLQVFVLQWKSKISLHGLNLI
jgi:hypothetical protein